MRIEKTLLKKSVLGIAIHLLVISLQISKLKFLQLKNDFACGVIALLITMIENISSCRNICVNLKNAPHNQ